MSVVELLPQKARFQYSKPYVRDCIQINTLVNTSSLEFKSPSFADNYDK